MEGDQGDVRQMVGVKNGSIGDGNLASYVDCSLSYHSLLCKLPINTLFPVNLQMIAQV